MPTKHYVTTPATVCNFISYIHLCQEIMLLQLSAGAISIPILSAEATEGKSERCTFMTLAKLKENLTLKGNLVSLLICSRTCTDCEHGLNTKYTVIELYKHFRFKMALLIFLCCMIQRL